MAGHRVRPAAARGWTTDPGTEGALGRAAYAGTTSTGRWAWCTSAFETLPSSPSCTAVGRGDYVGPSIQPSGAQAGGAVANDLPGALTD